MRELYAYRRLEHRYDGIEALTGTRRSATNGIYLQDSFPPIMGLPSACKLGQ